MSSVAGSCSKLVPDDWRTPVPDAPLPFDNTVGAHVRYGEAETAQLEKANGRTAGTIQIVERCESRDAAVVKALTPRPWWRVW